MNITQNQVWYPVTGPGEPCVLCSDNITTANQPIIQRVHCLAVHLSCHTVLTTSRYKELWLCLTATQCCSTSLQAAIKPCYRSSSIVTEKQIYIQIYKLTLTWNEGKFLDVIYSYLQPTLFTWWTIYHYMNATSNIFFLFLSWHDMRIFVVSKSHTTHYSR